MADTKKLRSDIQKLKKALQAKGVSKTVKDKLQGQLDKAESELAASKKPAKSAKPKKSTPLNRLQSLVKKKKYSAYSKAGVDLQKDAGQPALPTGKRTSKSGKTYYEYRANRIDVKQPPKRYPKLEDGGMMAEGGFFDKKEDVVFKFQEGEKIKVLQYSGGKLKPLEATIYKQYAAEQPDGTYYPFYWTVGSWEDFEEGKKHPSLYAEDELIERHKNKPKMADGGEVKDSSILQALSGYNSGLTKSGIAENLGLSNYRFGKYASESQMNSIETELKNLIELGYVEEGGVGYKITQKGARYLDTIPYQKREKGGYMANGGYMAEGGLTKEKLMDIEEEFDENEDDNYHSENVVLLARYFGTKEDLKEARSILKKHKEEGYLSGDNSKKRYELSMKLFDKWDEAKKEAGIMAKGGEVKVGDVITAKTGVKVKVVEYDPKFGGRVKVMRMDEYGTGEPSQFMRLSKFKYGMGGYMAEGGVMSTTHRLSK